MLKRNILLLIIAVALICAAIPLLRSRAAIFLNNRGNQLADCGEYYQAIVCFEQSLQLASNPTVHCNLAVACVQLRLFDEAIREYEEAIRLDPQLHDIYFNLIDLYRKEQRFEDAFHTLEKVSVFDEERASRLLRDIRQDHLTVLINQAVDSLQRGKRDEARLQLEAILTRYPDAVAACTMRGDIALGDGLYKEAVGYFERAIALGVEDAAVFHNAGICYMNLEQYPVAITYLQRAYALDPSNPTILYALASTCRDNREFDRAFSLYQILLQMQPNYLNVHNNMAAMYALQGKGADAEREYQHEIEIASSILHEQPKNYAAYASLARAYYGIKQYEDALTYINRALIYNDTSRELYYIRALINQGMGLEEEARRDFERARGLFYSHGFIDEHE